MRRILCAAIFFGAFTMHGCDSKPAPTDNGSQSDTDPNATSGAGDDRNAGGANTATANTADSGHPGVNSSAPPGEGGANAGTRTADASLDFKTPDGWIEEPPATSMRVNQYVLPGTAGEDDASVVVFYFGPGGAGAIDANVDRWIGQFEQPDGSSSAEKAQRSQMTIKGMNVTLVAVEGTYVASMAPGSAEQFNEPGYAMLAAIMESDHGPYFIKLIGPAAVVDHWEESYHEFLNTVRTPE